LLGVGGVTAGNGARAIEVEQSEDGFVDLRAVEAAGTAEHHADLEGHGD
jgi:hypothetical protein